MRWEPDRADFEWPATGGKGEAIFRGDVEVTLVKADGLRVLPSSDGAVTAQLRLLGSAAPAQGGRRGSITEETKEEAVVTLLNETLKPGGSAKKTVDSKMWPRIGVELFATALGAARRS